MQHGELLTNFLAFLKILGADTPISTSLICVIDFVGEIEQCNGRWYRGLNKDQYCREYNVLVCFQLDIASHRLVNNSINIQSLLFIQSIPEINYNHIEVSIVMRIYHGNEVAVCLFWIFVTYITTET